MDIVDFRHIMYSAQIAAAVLFIAAAILYKFLK